MVPATDTTFTADNGVWFTPFNIGGMTAVAWSVRCDKSAGACLGRDRYRGLRAFP